MLRFDEPCKLWELLHTSATSHPATPQTPKHSNVCGAWGDRNHNYIAPGPWSWQRPPTVISTTWSPWLCPASPPAWGGLFLHYNQLSRHPTKVPRPAERWLEKARRQHGSLPQVHVALVRIKSWIKWPSIFFAHEWEPRVFVFVYYNPMLYFFDVSMLK